jgi:RNA polymerase sigma factor (TIGR02999 family)
MNDPPEPTEVTKLLEELSKGRREVLDQLVPLVYDDLRAIARRRLAHEHDAQTLQATALVHEAFARLVDQRVAFQNRSHFFAIAARCMRRVLVDHVRQKHAAKRPQRGAGINLDDVLVLSDPAIERVIAVNEALDQLALLDARQAQVAEMRYFGGATNEEIAAALSISEATVKRDWVTAKLFLQKALRDSRNDA